MAYQGINAAASTTPADIPAFTASKEGLQAVQQKLATFRQAVNSHQPGTISLTADDLNTMLANSPDVARNNVRAFISLTNDAGRLQLSIPGEAMLGPSFKGRYFNIDATFTVSFDTTTKNVVISPQALQVGDKVLMGANAEQSTFTQGFVKGFVPSFNQSFNQGLRKNPGAAELLDQAQTITIKDSQLVISTQ